MPEKVIELKLCVECRIRPYRKGTRTPKREELTNKFYIRRERSSGTSNVLLDAGCSFPKKGKRTPKKKRKDKKKKEENPLFFKKKKKRINQDQGDPTSWELGL